MAIRDRAKTVASDIKKVLGENHVSTVVYGTYFDHLEGSRGGEDDSYSNIPLLIVVKNFDEDCALKLYKILRTYDREGIDTPYVVEIRDLKGMLDSTPQKIMDIKANYAVLEGEDVLELRSEPEFEYLRAHVELVLRRMIYGFRHDLILVMLTKLDVTKYIKDLSLASLNAIKNFHMLVHPELASTNEHLDFFYREFPESKDILKELLDCVSSAYRGEQITGKDLLELITNVINNVLQPLLREVDTMGQSILEEKMSKIEEIVETKKREMKLEMVKEKLELVAKRKELKQVVESQKKHLEIRKKELETQLEAADRNAGETGVSSPRQPMYPPPPPPSPVAQRQNDPYYQERYYQPYYDPQQLANYPPSPPQPMYRAPPGGNPSQAPAKVSYHHQPMSPASQAPAEVHEEELSAFEKILKENQNLKRTRPVRK